MLLVMLCPTLKLIIHSHQIGLAFVKIYIQLSLVHDLAISLNNKSQCEVVLLDFSKAFDCVSHYNLLLKLNH